MIKKTFIIMISICLIQLFSDNSFTVEPEEVLENQKQEMILINFLKEEKEQLETERRKMK